MTTHAGVAEALADPRIRKDERHRRAFDAGEGADGPAPPPPTIVSGVATLPVRLR
ncbi:hypothetical protein ABZ234_25230 [Nocardiopsis sp. NPDC006198]|uniref:hypothetical protein n=1 Tax=Nocardiopsis sp. NPDC006198 TaxID=3154472 RepID=UPI0033B9402B